MANIFLHLGCDLGLSKQAVAVTEGVTLLEQMHAGSKLSSESDSAQDAYYAKYRRLFEEKFGFPIGYREIASAPENREVRVMWGELRKSPEFGRAIRLGVQWFIRSERNPHANDRPCEIPLAWRD